jgi:iron complex outermembrane receptor protein
MGDNPPEPKIGLDCGPFANPVIGQFAKGRALKASRFSKAAWRCAGLLAVAVPAAAFAQHSADNAQEGAEDAFGGSMGWEDVGIYTSTNVRGFNPQQAGNARIDGVYFDQLSTLAQRLREGSNIRVGFAALDYFSPSPTGIVAWRTHPSGDDFVATLNLASTAYGAGVQSLDLGVPVIDGHVSFSAGFGHGIQRYADGFQSENFARAFIPRIRFGSVEIKAFVSGFSAHRMKVRPLAITTGPFVPKMPGRREYLGQKWAKGQDGNWTHGATVKVGITKNLQFRGGLFRSELNHGENFTELYFIENEAGAASHILLADPKQQNYANSWEGLFTWRSGEGRVKHRVIAGARGRYRKRESGGSDFIDFTPGTTTIPYGDPDDHPLPDISYGPLNIGNLRQVAYTVGYIGSIEGIGQINLGLNETDYDASFAAAGGLQTVSKANPWLYNASVMVRPADWLSFYAGIVTGLEDNGSAPESAANRNEQLPALKTKQIDAGVQVKLGKVTLVSSVFQIEKPYFAFDAVNRYTQLGGVRHRGIEFSATGNLTERLHVLAGGVMMDPVVTGPGVALGISGKRPVGTPRIYGKIDLSYRTDILDGVTFTASLEHASKRPVSSGTYAALGGGQLALPSRTMLDLGVRHHFKVSDIPVSLRFVVENVFDRKSWDVLASNSLRPAERRSLSLYLIADF